MKHESTLSATGDNTPSNYLLDQSRKEAKRLLKLALANAGVISINKLNEAQEVVARMKGKGDWHELATLAASAPAPEVEVANEMQFELFLTDLHDSECHLQLNHAQLALQMDALERNIVAADAWVKRGAIQALYEEPGALFHLGSRRVVNDPMSPSAEEGSEAAAVRSVSILMQNPSAQGFDFRDLVFPLEYARCLHAWMQAALAMQLTSETLHLNAQDPDRVSEIHQALRRQAPEWLIPQTEARGRIKSMMQRVLGREPEASLAPHTDRHTMIHGGLEPQRIQMLRLRIAQAIADRYGVVCLTSQPELLAHMQRAIHAGWPAATDPNRGVEFNPLASIYTADDLADCLIPHDDISHGDMWRELALSFIHPACDAVLWLRDHKQEPVTVATLARTLQQPNLWLLLNHLRKLRESEDVPIRLIRNLEQKLEGSGERGETEDQISFLLMQTVPALNALKGMLLPPGAIEDALFRGKALLIHLPKKEPQGMRAVAGRIIMRMIAGSVSHLLTRDAIPGDSQETSRFPVNQQRSRSVVVMDDFDDYLTTGINRLASYSRAAGVALLFSRSTIEFDAPFKDALLGNILDSINLDAVGEAAAG